MATLQISKPTQADPCHKDQSKHEKITQTNEKKHHIHFWKKPANEHKNEQGIINNKHQHHKIALPKKGTNEHKHGHATNKARQQEASSHPGGQHKLRQCFGHGAQLGGDSDADEETETIVIERKIKERVVISHVKKCHDHKEGVKHLDRC